jgi:hypothetical protein
MGKLLFISDLEGCAKTSPSGEPQSQYLCSMPFFEMLDNFLNEEALNKVAFLGDYFDQGPLVVDSINYIMELYSKYKERVIIILGNRDLNKLRLIYEVNAQMPVGKEQWTAWMKFYNTLATSPMERLQNILSNSMGAKWPLILDPALTLEQSAYLLVRAFSEPAAASLPAFELSGKYADFVDNCRALFTVGKIVTIDYQYDVLLSHAGGAEPFLLHDMNYYNNIINLINAQPFYYNKIEIVRQELQKPPLGESYFDESVYNSPLEKIPAMFDSQEPPPEFFLIQGLGLKPDGNNPFTSFVQSCDIKSCSGPSDPLYPSEYKKYLKYLEEQLDVKAIAHGHSPHCAPVPLVYKRPEAEIFFIANDTSNGYRPIIKDMPFRLAYITEGDHAEVGIMPENIPNPSIVPVDKPDSETFKPMISSWKIEDAPKYDPSRSAIDYGGGKMLTFPSKNNSKNPFTPAALIGGGRKTKKNKKQRKQTKKTKKSKKRNHLRN